ncbi:hypothetical protein F5B20DRAFT_568661 [Whalleya microplaca]|nr:hypothetical protein F5B20DRAFT_568661 [Whalleya microplaca]
MAANIENEQVVDVQQDQKGYIGATHWALPYVSNHNFENPQTNTALLAHVNCGYLSTPGRPPTLLALKQHAQSLAVLISSLAPSSTSAEIDNENQEGEKRRFPKHEAFDYLNNLQVHYDSLDAAHKAPLNSLVNLIRENSDVEGVEYHCPLTTTRLEFAEQQERGQFRPFQTHMTLLMHANECLERLDHEYSAMGGLLSIIPLENEDVNELEGLKSAKETLVGQWILYTQHLVSRMHELEIAYGNSLDLLDNEAVVPAQHISVHGPDGRSGREIVYPQDRWILANAGDDVFSFIHQMLDRKEAVLDRRDKAYMDQNVVGGALRKDDDLSKLRGIVEVDLNTRFYRIKGSGHGPIFVLPAFADRPGTEYTREMEKRPTVVTITQPSFPDRSSAWDKKNYQKDTENRKQFLEISSLKRKIAELESGNQLQTHQLDRLRHVNSMYETSQGKDAKQMAEAVANAVTERNQYEEQFNKLSQTAKALQAELSVFKQKGKLAQADNPATIIGATQEGNDLVYTVHSSWMQVYQARSNAVENARDGVERSRNILKGLAAAGHLNLADFNWMSGLQDCP